jgi:ribonuclease VapC
MIKAVYVDSSAIVAIILDDPDAAALLKRLMAASNPFTSIVTKVEASLALTRISGKAGPAAQMVVEFLDRLDIRVIAVEPTMFEHVMQAAARYGRRSGHRAQLNFGDCFSYAFAKQAKVPLLYKGNDFAQTDLVG